MLEEGFKKKKSTRGLKDFWKSAQNGKLSKDYIGSGQRKTQFFESGLKESTKLSRYLETL